MAVLMHKQQELQRMRDAISELRQTHPPATQVHTALPSTAGALPTSLHVARGIAVFCLI
jgi:transketolase N-terminal domain/subunit